jgi:hypothetical protein
VLSPQDTQHRCDGAPAGRQDGAGEQHQGVRPGRTGEQIGKDSEPTKRCGSGSEARGPATAQRGAAAHWDPSNGRGVVPRWGRLDRAVRRARHAPTGSERS